MLNRQTVKYFCWIGAFSFFFFIGKANASSVSYNASSGLFVVFIVVLLLFFIFRFKRGSNIQEEGETEHSRKMERYQAALLEWSEARYDTADHAMQKAAEISAETIEVKRVGVWLYNEERTALECRALYIKGEGCINGGVLDRKDFPTYFLALDTGRRLVLNDVRTDPMTKELVEPYAIDYDIYSMLDIPIFNDGAVVGVVCHEHTGARRCWSTNEQDFASIIASHISLAVEVDKRKKTEQSLEHQSFHDSLTGLPNRALFLDRIAQEIRHAKHGGSHLAVLFLDLDHFKRINESFGLSSGDKALVLIAQRIRDVLRVHDTVARLGGDEFIILLSELYDTGEINEVVSRLFMAIKEPLVIDNTELFITTSLGVSVYPNDGQTEEVLLRNADSAMYRAKEKGRNSFEFYTSDMTEKALAKVQMIACLKRALEEEELEIYYQPQFDSKSKTVYGLEALVRWQHPDLGFLSPAQFLPVAEESGLIVAIDRWVMEASLKQMQAWCDDGLELGRLSLNLTMEHLDQTDFMEFLTDLLARVGCTGELIVFEVTEGQLMKNPDKTIESLNWLSDLGIQIAVDDFGTGYSSLSYLKKLPVDTLKIDREFVRDLPGDEDDIAIVNSIIGLSKSMNMEVLAEGVETQEQLEFLASAGCRLIQGYLLSRPIPGSKISEFKGYPAN